MLRKFGLGLVAASALVIGMAGMTSAASARGGHWHGGGGGHWHGGGGHWHGGGWHGGWGHRGWGWGGPRFYGYGGPYYYGGYGGCFVRRLVPTPWGPRWRLINRCY